MSVQESPPFQRVKKLGDSNKSEFIWNMMVEDKPSQIARKNKKKRTIQGNRADQMKQGVVVTMASATG